MAQALSERSLTNWQAFAQSIASDDPSPLDRDLLYRFLIGMHGRGEELTAHQLKTMVDELDLPDEEARSLIAFIEPALGLLQAYDRASDLDDDEDFDIGPGVLVM